MTHDMSPYTCIARNCPEELLMFQTRSQWETHLKDRHEPRWECPLCDMSDFPLNTVNDTKRHIEDAHGDQLKHLPLETVVSWCAVPDLGLESCPLCSPDLAPDSSELIDHVLSHVYEFSLRALPWTQTSIYPLGRTLGSYSLGNFPSTNQTSYLLPSSYNSQTGNERTLNTFKDLITTNLNETTQSDHFHKWISDLSHVEPERTDEDEAQLGYSQPNMADVQIQVSLYDDTINAGIQKSETDINADFFDKDEYFQGGSANESRVAQLGDNESEDNHQSGRIQAIMAPKLQRTDYHVAWISPLSDLELLPSRLMLDEEHEAPDYDTSYDDNVYICGTMGGHNVVIATCPPGSTGNVNAGRVADPLFKTFSSLRMTLLIGVGGGVPYAQPRDDPTEDVHLGDVVVGWPGDGVPACVCYDSESCVTMDKPDRLLFNALAKLASDHEIDRSKFQEHRNRLLQSKHKRKFTFPGLDQDLLFKPTYSHDATYKHCGKCDRSELVRRPARTEHDIAGFIFHQGRVATGNAVIRDAERRDQIQEHCNGTLCIDTEAAGINVSGRCLVVRGISDYADTHSDNTWRSYAAGNAAMFARELLSKIPPGMFCQYTAHFVSSTAIRYPCTIYLEVYKS